MTREESMKISAAIGNIITNRPPVIKCDERSIAAARAALTPEELKEMQEIGLYDGDFLKFYIIREFCSLIGLGDIADGYYILELFANAAHLDADRFENDPYLRAVHFPKTKRDNILLTHAEYAAGEIFQYDEPNFSGRFVVPKLGFFDRTVSFPTIYEGNIPWMSVCPSEMLTMEKNIEMAHGRVLVLGLGLGYYPFMIARRSEVEHITVVELNDKIIDIFNENVFPSFENKSKIDIVRGDAIRYLDDVKKGDYDFCFADIWEGAVDGARFYKQILPHEMRLTGTEFAYWLKRPILAYLEEE